MVKRAFLAIGVLLVGGGCQAAFAAGGPTKKILVIGVDGLRPDAMAVASTPNIDGLIATGAYSDDAQCEDLTFSGPNWSSILHGVHRDKHTVTTNDYTGSSLANHPDFLAWIEAHDPTKETIRLSTWDAIFNFQPTGADIDIFHDYAVGGDARVTNETQWFLLDTHPLYPGTDVDALFVYLADVDVAGHGSGFDPDSPPYIAEIENIDSQVGIMVTAMQQRPTFASEDWLVILTSDHGGSITGSHGGNTLEKRRIPFLVSGSSAVVGGIHPQPKNVDVSKTVLAHLGVPIPASLDGHVVGLSPSAPLPAAFDIELIRNGGAEYDRGFNDFFPDQYLSGWLDPGPDQYTSIAYGSAGGWPLLTDPGPPNRGTNFFCGNTTGGNRLAQSIDVAPLAAAIDAESTRFELSAWLGGFGTQDDRAQVSAYFLDANGALLGVETIGPVTAADRGGATGLLLRESKNLGVPSGTRTVEVALRAIHDAGGGTDGYADNISFVIRAGGAPPPPRPGVGIPTLGTTEWRFTGDTGAFVDAAFGPGTLEYADGVGGATDLADSFVASDGIQIPHIDGVPVSCLHFQARSTATQGYLVRSGINTPADVGVRQFTMVFDLLVPSNNTNSWLAMWNASPTNANDSEFFLRPGIEGLWTTDAGTRDGTWKRGVWNRFVFVNDFEGAGTVAVYLNGRPAPELEAFASDWVDDGTPNPFWILADDTPAETSEGYLANFAFVDDVLSEAEIASLGGPNADGVFPACGFSLGASAASVAFGDAVSLTTCGGIPGQPVILVVTSAGGIPFFVPINLIGTINTQTLWTLAGPYSVSIGPAELGFTAFSLNAGQGVIQSNEVRVFFEN